MTTFVEVRPRPIATPAPVASPATDQAAYEALPGIVRSSSRWAAPAIVAAATALLVLRSGAGHNALVVLGAACTLGLSLCALVRVAAGDRLAGPANTCWIASCRCHRLRANRIRSAL